MVDILLINPPYYKPVEKQRVYYTSIPLNLGYLAAVLERDTDYSIQVIDYNVEEYSDSHIQYVVDQTHPTIVGISVLTNTLPQAYQIIQAIKQTSSAVVVVGGPQITGRPETITELGADAGVCGEAEYVFTQLCKEILEGKLFDSVPGVLKPNDPINKTNKPSIIENLDTLPYPTRWCFNLEKYKFTPIAATRGCPYKCIYCSSVDLYRQRSIEHVMGEVWELVRHYKTKTLSFVDDTFTYDKTYILELCDNIKQYNLKWSCTTRVDLVDSGLLNQMYTAGCNHISFGVESGVEKIRYGLGRPIPNKTHTNAFRWCREIGIETRANAMFGLPGETTNNLIKTTEFIKKLRPDQVVFTPTTINPGTKLEEIATRDGVIKPDTWKRYMLSYTKTPPTYLPPGVSYDELFSIIYNAEKSFYIRPSYVIQQLFKWLVG